MRLSVKEIYNRQPIFYNWLLTYIVLVLFFVLLSGTLNSFTIKSLNEAVEKANTSYLSYVRDIAEFNIGNMESQVLGIAESTAVSRLMSVKNESEAYEGDLFAGAIKDIKSYKSDVSLAEEVFVVFKNIDACISGASKYTNKLAFEAYFNKYYDSIADWEADLSLNNMKKYKMFTDENGASRVLFMQTLPITINNSQPKATAIALIDVGRMRALLSSDSKPNDSGSVFVLDGVNELLFGVAPVIKTDEFDNNTGAGSHMDKEGGYWTVFQSDAQSGRKYVLAVPDEEYRSQIRQNQALSYIFYAIFLMFGIFYSYYIARMNYQPVRRIINKLTGGKAGDTAPRYSYINDTISKIISDKEAYNLKIERQRETLKSEFIRVLLTDKTNSSDASDYFEEYGIDLDGGELAVIAFDLTDYGELVPLAGERFDWKKNDLARFAIANVFDEIIASWGAAYFCETETYYACIIKTSDENGYALIDEALKFLVEFFKSNMNMEFTCAVSDLRDARELLPYLFRQACDVMAYRLVNGGAVILHHSDIIKEKDSYKYSIDVERQIYNNILTGDHKNALERIFVVFDLNFNKTRLDLNMSRLLIFEIVSTVIKAINELGVPVDILEERNRLLLDNVFSSKTTNEIKKVLSDVIREVCTLSNDIKKRSGGKLKDSITEILERHLSDNRMSLNMLANELGMTSNHLSLVFKNQFGMPFSEYVPSQRLARAKQLLLGTTLDINKIAEATGFTNAHMFIRAFKKSEGVTPTQYRKK